MEKIESKAIVFTVIDHEGAAKVFVNEPWPQFTSPDYQAVAEVNPGLVFIDGDSLRFHAENGSAEYLKVDAEGETGIYELVDSTFEPFPAAEQPEEPEDITGQTEDDEKLAPAEDAGIDDAEVAPLVIDTRAEDEPVSVFEPRKTFGQAVAAEVRAAHLRNDAPGHAALHNFDIALGDFKRAAQSLLPSLSKESELAQIVASIVSDL